MTEIEIRQAVTAALEQGFTRDDKTIDILESIASGRPVAQTGDLMAAVLGTDRTDEDDRAAARMLLDWERVEEDGISRVVVETMPRCWRESHKAAGNRGVYPHNGSERFACDEDVALDLVEEDEDWTRIVEDADPAGYEYRAEPVID